MHMETVDTPDLSFIEKSDGENLSECLVAKGLARAFGVFRQESSGNSGVEWREKLKDRELLAARTGKGAWSRTSREKLPEIREEVRREFAEVDIARGSQPAVEGKTININSASQEELMTLPNIGEKTALLWVLRAN